MYMKNGIYGLLLDGAIPNIVDIFTIFGNTLTLPRHSYVAATVRCKQILVRVRIIL